MENTKKSKIKMDCKRNDFNLLDYSNYSYSMQLCMK